MYYNRYIVFLDLVIINWLVIKLFQISNHSNLNSTVSSITNEKEDENWLISYYMIAIKLVLALISVILFSSTPLIQMTRTDKCITRLVFYFLHVLFTDWVVVNSVKFRFSMLSLIYWILCENLSLQAVVFNELVKKMFSYFMW
jgi:hypothetical protein